MKWFLGITALILTLCAGISWGKFLATIGIENELVRAVQEKSPFYVGKSSYKLYPISSDKYCIGVMKNGRNRGVDADPKQFEYRVGDTKILEDKASAYHRAFEPHAFYAQRVGAERIGPDSYSGGDTVRGPGSGRLEKAAYREEEVR